MLLRSDIFSFTNFEMGATITITGPEKASRVPEVLQPLPSLATVAPEARDFSSPGLSTSTSGTLPSRAAARNTPPGVQPYDPDLPLTWADGSPVIDCAEFADPLPESGPVDDCYEGECLSLKLETRGATRQLHDGKTTDGQLWKSQTVWKFSVAAKLREAGMREDAQSLEDCHSRRVFAQCTGCHDVQVFRNRCDLFFCPECQPKLARKRAESVSWWVEQLTQPKHVVLTVRNIPTITKGHVLELKKWFTKLRHRRVCRNWRGGLYSVEVTNEGKGWHLHLHILTDSRWVDGGHLAAEWNAVNNGHGNIVKVKDCRNADYLREVTKYAVKGSDLAKWTPAQIAEFITAFRGTKTFGVFGSLYGKRTEWRQWIESLGAIGNICRCGCNQFKFYDEASWLARDCVPGPTSSARPPPQATNLEFANLLTPTYPR